MHRGAAIAIFAAATTAADHAHAFTYQYRWVERFGNTDVVLGGDNTTVPADGLEHRIRLQCGVFTDTVSAAPPGGFVGWNAGMLEVSGGPISSINRRTPGRLAPFTWYTTPGANGNPPLPAGDPFFRLTDLEVALGVQTIPWLCVDTNGDGVPDAPSPQPGAMIVGRNTFVPLYEITTQALPELPIYTITASGTFNAASEWRVIAHAIEPDCEEGIPGFVNYAPFPVSPLTFQCRLNFVIPGPGGLAPFIIGAIAASRRRRLSESPLTRSHRA